MDTSTSNNPDWPIGLPIVGPYGNIGHAEAQQTYDGVAEVVPRRVHLAQALQEAHTVQVRNTRALEQNYHALRGSNQASERRWDLYCTELDHGIDAPHWQNVRGHPRQSERYQQLNLVDELDQDGAEAAIGKYQLRRPQAPAWERLESEPLQERQAAWPLPSPRADAQGPQLPGQDFPGERHPLRQNPPTQESARSYTLAVKRRNTRIAELPSREQLVELSELVRQRVLSSQVAAQSTTTAKPIINIIPPTPPETQERIVGLQQQPRSMRVVELISSVSQSPEIYPLSRPWSVNLHGNADSNLSTCPTFSTEGHEVPITHEKRVYQPGVEGSLGSPERVEYAASQAWLAVKTPKEERVRLRGDAEM
ncbi:MAG: hypothetical protein LQ345_000093 [Seirophora villosa]|nr:MAG: hypothetical protein LQ345_000093 [Seirophora villosa]